MVRYQANPGDADTRRTARAKHPVLFDLPADRGVEIKKAFPDLGWLRACTTGRCSVDSAGYALRP